jgi:hypothetical protein
MSRLFRRRVMIALCKAALRRCRRRASGAFSAPARLQLRMLEDEDGAVYDRAADGRSCIPQQVSEAGHEAKGSQRP